ncbi:hypothetical protein D3C80_1893190 [compost metagenome]
MPQRQRGTATGDRVRSVLGNGVRAIQVFVQVAATDAAVGDLDFYFAGLGGSRFQFGEAQVSGAMPAQCFHRGFPCS